MTLSPEAKTNDVRTSQPLMALPRLERGIVPATSIGVSALRATAFGNSATRGWMVAPFQGHASR